MGTQKIHIIGIGDDGLVGVISPARQLVEQAELLIGAESTLAKLPKLKAERLVVGGNLDQAIADAPPAGTQPRAGGLDLGRSRFGHQDGARSLVSSHVNPDTSVLVDQVPAPAP